MIRRLFSAILLTAAGFAMAQAPGVPVERASETTGNKDILDKAGVLREAGKLAAAGRIKELLAVPVAECLSLIPAKTEALSRAEIYEQARHSRVRVGWYYLCRKCSHWHTRLAGGYPLTEDGAIVTCHHVVTPGDDMREGYLIVVDADGMVSPVTSIIADSAARDVCVLRVTGGKFLPLPLNDTVRPGDAAFCLSDPLGANGYFSDGMVNRFYLKRFPGAKPADADSLRLNVSTDWAPGSSGSPVLDQCGNVIGHVSTVSPMSEAKGSGGKKGGTQIVLHEASPARSVIALLKTAAEAAAKTAAPAP